MEIAKIFLWKRGEVEEIVSHPGLAKFIIGCTTKQVRSSRAMHRTKGH